MSAARDHHTSGSQRADAVLAGVLAAAGSAVLVGMARDTPMLTVLRELCDAAAAELGAARVWIVLDPEVAAEPPDISSDAEPPGEASVDESVEEQEPIVSPPGLRLGVLHAVWRAPRAPAGQADMSGFAMLARIVLERHLTQRQRVVMIARERDRIAGLLHDDPIQSMTAVSLQLQRLARRLPAGPDREAAESVRRTTDATIDRLRHMLFSLHPVTLEEDGLVAALEVYCESFVEPEGMAWNLTPSIDVAIPYGVAALAFRLARGAIENAVKHSEAARLTIELGTDKSVLDITVRDDGVGFNPEWTHQTRPGHLGLAHARYLVSLAGGRYEIVSSPGEGTTVHITLSLL
ncbi:MAG: hypothetical protein KDB21_02840 [Acidimicrobiales bacterium]|nr:hypothetical protein [Acidimicrobiales bacterium]